MTKTMGRIGTLRWLALYATFTLLTLGVLGIWATRPAVSGETQERITATCPNRWEITQVKNAKHGDAWLYTCQATRVTIAFPTNEPHAGLRGSVKGDKSASWVR